MKLPIDYRIQIDVSGLVSINKINADTIIAGVDFTLDDLKIDNLKFAESIRDAIIEIELYVKNMGIK